MFVICDLMECNRSTFHVGHFHMYKSGVNVWVFVIFNPFRFHFTTHQMTSVQKVSPLNKEATLTIRWHHDQQ